MYPLRMIAIPLLVLTLSLSLTACLDTMTEQDRAFISKIKERLKHKGDVVRVSDIHPGDWQSVCFTTAGAKDEVMPSIAERERIDEAQLIVRNRKRSDVGHTDMYDWGIYFFYPPNEIEYYQIFNGDTYPSQIGAVTDEYSCVLQNDAHFKAMGDLKVNKYRDNYLDIQLTEIKEGK